MLGPRGPHAVRTNPGQAAPQLGWPRPGGLVRDRSRALPGALVEESFGEPSGVSE
jgi:hypothetical protein